MTLEEKYIKMGRSTQERREPPQSSRRSAAGRRGADQWDEPPSGRKQAGRKPAKGRQGGKPKRSRAAAVGLGAYKVLVVISALIVAAYIGLQMMSKAPEQKPPVGDSATDTTITGNSSTDTAAEDPNALVRRDGVYNIFLAATDVEGYRTDTMMVMSYDTVEQRVGVISIPRDTITNRDSGSNPKLVYGSGGVAQRIEDVSKMLGIPIDGYVKVDINGFIALVDYLGGVELDIPLDMNYDDPYQDLHIHFTKGTHQVDGQGAMEAARYRHDNYDSPNYNANQWYSDIQRSQMQQQILVKLAQKVLAWDSLTKINGFVEIFNQYVETDLTLNNLLYFAQQGVNLDVSTGVETATLEGRGDANYSGYTWCFEPDQEKTVELVNRLINPYTRDLTLEDMDLMTADGYYYTY